MDRQASIDVCLFALCAIVSLFGCSFDTEEPGTQYYFDGNYYTIAIDASGVPVEDGSFAFVDSLMEDPDIGVFTTGLSDIVYMYRNDAELEDICEMVLGPTGIAKGTLAAEYWVDSYADSNFSGDEMTTVSSRPNLHDYGWGDRISSFKVYSSYDSCVYRFFENGNYGGKEWAVNPRERQTYEGKEYYYAQDKNLSDNKMSGMWWWKKYWNDRISSIEYFR